MPRARRPRLPAAPRPARQARAERTLEALVRAAELLLQKRDWDAIGIAELCRRAGCTTGAFYARFRAKDDLLPFIYARYDAELPARFSGFLADARSAPDLRTLVHAGVARIVAEYRERRWLLRAVGLFSRAQPEALSADLRQRRARVHDMPLELFLRFRSDIRHADPAAAVRTGIFIVASAARDKILFEAPHATATPLTDDQLAAELARAFYAYLTV